MSLQQGGTIHNRIKWMLAILAGIIMFVVFNYSDLSSTDSQVKVGKHAAESIAASYWNQQHVDVKGFKRTAILQDDTTLDGYLSLHQLQDPFQKQFSTLHPLQYWEVTYYKQNVPYQYVTRIHPNDGKVLGFSIETSQASAGLKQKPIHPAPFINGSVNQTKEKPSAIHTAGNQQKSFSQSPGTYDSQDYDSLSQIQTIAQQQLTTLKLLEKGKQSYHLDYKSQTRNKDATTYAFQVSGSNQNKTVNQKDSLNKNKVTAINQKQTNPLKIGQAPLQVEVQIFNGSHKLKGFSTSFAVPKVDKDWFQVQSKHSEIMTWIFMGGQFLFFVAAIVVLFVKRHKGVRYGTGFRLIVLAFVFDLLINLNSLPSLQSQMGFQTLASRMPILTDGWIALFIIMSSVLEVGMLYVITVAGGALAKDVLGDRWLSWRHPNWPRRVRNAAFRGYALAIIWLGLQTLFYYIGQKYFHVWEQNDTDSSPWNNVLPSIMPIAAWFAGINEELTFRLFGFALFKKLLKNTWLALIIPAMIWALGHSLYPVFPIYTRFVELTIFGTLIGWCMLKWDLETVIFAHVAFDSILMSLSLLSDQSSSQVPAAILWGVGPLLVGILIGTRQPNKKIWSSDL